MNAGTFFHEKFPRKACATVTAGLRWPPVRD